VRTCVRLSTVFCGVLHRLLLCWAFRNPSTQTPCSDGGLSECCRSTFAYSWCRLKNLCFQHHDLPPLTYFEVLLSNWVSHDLQDPQQHLPYTHMPALPSQQPSFSSKLTSCALACRFMEAGNVASCQGHECMPHITQQKKNVCSRI
jgi:hypothetical protein